MQSSLSLPLQPASTFQTGQASQASNNPQPLHHNSHSTANLTKTKPKKDEVPFWQRIFKNTSYKPGDNLSMAACCTVRTLDEMALIIDGLAQKSHQTIVLPNLAHPAQTAVTGLTLGIGAMGIIAATKIFRYYNQRVKDLKQAKAQLKANTNNYKTDNSRNGQIRRAYIKYAKRQINHARFEKWFAGFFSGTSTAGVAIGSIVKHATPIGLYIASLHSAARVIKYNKEFFAAKKIIRRLNAKLAAEDSLKSSEANTVGLQALSKQEDVQSTQRYFNEIRYRSMQVQKSYFKRVRKWGLLNVASWGIEFIGTGLMGTLNLAAWKLTISTGFVALPFMAPVMIATAALSTLWTNNKATSDAYQPAFNTKELKEIEMKTKNDGDISSLLSPEQIDLKLIEEDHRHQLYRRYKKVVLNTVGFGTEYTSRRWALRFAGLATIGLAHNWVAKQKFYNKQAFVRRSQKYFKAQGLTLEQERFSLLTQRFDQSKIIHGNAHHKGFTDEIHAKHQTIQVAKTMQDRNLELIKLLDDMNLDDKSQIFKLFAKKVLAKKPVNNAGQKEYPLKGKYAFLYGAGHIDAKTLIDDLNQLVMLKSCCEGHAYAMDVLEALTINVNQSSELTVQEAIQKILTESIDQYLIFQMGKESNREIAKLSELRQGFDDEKWAAAAAA